MSSCPFDAAALSEGLASLTATETAEMDRPGLRKYGEAPELPTLVLRHAGGSFGEVDVLEATPDGALHVRWRNAVGSAPYVLHCTRVWPKPKTDGKNGSLPLPIPIAGRVDLAAPTGVLLWKSNRAKSPLPWSALDAKEAKRLWRRLTGKTEKTEKTETEQGGTP